MSDEPSNGHCKWRGWAFDYGVLGTEGLSLYDGHFNKTRVFNKLSLPVIRVKYVRDEDPPFNGPLFFQKEACGPYNDQITWDTDDFGEDLLNFVNGGPHHLVKMENCGDRYICVSETQIGTETWLQVGVYARIGAYHIYQVWYLHETGKIMPRVFSKGLSCNLKHWHHPYWRFDLDGRDKQTARIFSNDTFVNFFSVEMKFQNSMFGSNVVYKIENQRTGTEVSIQPPLLNEQLGIVGPTPFAPFDGIIRKYRPEEDVSWPAPPENDIEYSVFENPDGQHIVFWSICHILHNPNEGKDHWHSVGPNLAIQLSDRVNIKSFERRRITVEAHINVKDFKLVGKDKWGHFNHTESTEVNPREEYDEFFFDKDQTGDVTAQLLIRVQFQDDLSVRIDFEAKLFDEAEEVASVGNGFFLLRDSKFSWSGIHLVDYHGGDPDTADMDFVITNDQVP
jgi:hypothetical protein